MQQRATWRRRSDGILEIVRPQPVHRLREALFTGLAALTAALVPSIAVLVYLLAGMPLLLVGGVAFFGVVAWRGWKRRHRPDDDGLSTPGTPASRAG